MTVDIAEHAPGVYELHPYDWNDWHAGIVDWKVSPAYMGKVWERDAIGRYVLPEYTLGWQILKWIEENLLSDESSEDEVIPFSPTDEQKRFILWWYAVDENGQFYYREGVLQRMKGWGKDPISAVLSAVEFVGPCRFAGWAARDMPEIGVAYGEPVAKAHARSWVQIAATTAAQTKNTMMIFSGLFTEECKAEHGIDMGKEVIYAYGGNKRIEIVTSSPRSLEGNRPTFVLKNETHHWLEISNNGVDMADAIERNLTKAKGGAARSLSITNAYEPSEDSVARRERDAYLELMAKEGKYSTIMYDSLEAPVNARLRPAFPDENGGKCPPIPDEIKKKLTRRYIGRVLEAVRGDSVWLNIPAITDSILNPKNKASRSRRFFYNQVTAAEDAWVHPGAVDAAVNRMAAEARELQGHEPMSILTAGWLVAPDEPVVMFFDGSKSDDATALVGCRLSDGYVFTIGVWSRPNGERGKTWLAPRNAVDQRVAKAFELFNIVAFWGDPSHTKDEMTDSSYWMPMLDKWMREYKDRLDPKHWPVKSGLSKHAINFDMALPMNTKLFISGAEQVVEDLENKNDVEEFQPLFEIDGHPTLMTHMKNAIAHYDPRGWGISLSKVDRESARKIDAAVCLVGARLMRRVVLNLHEEEEEEELGGEIW